MNTYNRCLYNKDFNSFLNENTNSIFGTIDQNYHGVDLTTAREAWIKEIEILKEVLEPYRNESGQIIFEYDIPRLGKRIDVVLLLKGIIFSLEFKVGEKKILEGDIDQALDYALDLANFHKYSQDKLIVPILIATKYGHYSTEIKKSTQNSNIINLLIAGEKGLDFIIASVLKEYPNEAEIDADKWIKSPYSPTPTIIEAAKSLYLNHTVEDITRHGTETDDAISYITEVIEKTKINHEKSICFVTGVPGAGKTLVGLDVAIKQTYKGNDIPSKEDQAVYLSGNGPLVAVLTEALARDNVNRAKEKKKKKKITDARREVSKSIQIIHKYRDTMLAKIKNPVENGKLEIDPEKAEKNGTAGFGEVEHIAIFDEAQRSWTHKRLAEYLKKGGTYGNKLKVENFPMSEAAFLIWSLDQRKDWATIICLVGGGQEINTGEAGIAEWIEALNKQFPHWKVYISPKLSDKEYAEGKVNELLKDNKNVIPSEKLHLSVSLRSFKAEKLSSFVQALLTFDPNASSIYKEFKDQYPIYLTRDMDTARNWLREKTGGTERNGVLVTKEAARYKPLAVHILPSKDINTIHWFLEDRTDVRASNYLEDAATEIQVQGLELDYACVLWDADMQYKNGKWHYFKFNGKTNWTEQNKNTEENMELRKYMLNAYRVLLTRARSGMIICVPKGCIKDENNVYADKTRKSEYYEGTYQYFKKIGLDEI